MSSNGRFDQLQFRNFLEQLSGYMQMDAKFLVMAMAYAHTGHLVADEAFFEVDRAIRFVWPVMGRFCAVIDDLNRQIYNVSMFWRNL